MSQSFVSLFPNELLGKLYYTFIHPFLDYCSYSHCRMWNKFILTTQFSAIFSLNIDFILPSLFIVLFISLYSTAQQDIHTRNLMLQINFVSSIFTSFKISTVRISSINSRTGIYHLDQNVFAILLSITVFQITSQP